jgi:ATP-dependent helicase HrpB
MLPIDSLLPALKETLRSRNSAVLVAAPGAGKTTRIPLALIDEPWLAEHKRIVMVEPRRLATRSAARFMAAILGQQAGETVGYRVKRDSCVSVHTRIEVITEGILTRMIQTDPGLSDIGLVIFDEFHERNLHADLGLALCLQTQAMFREDLRILIMSATLDDKPVAALLNDAPILKSEGRAFPIETRFLKLSIEGRLEQAVAKCVLQALKDEQGDLMVFLPGMGEIRRVEGLLNGCNLDKEIRIYPLHGTLPLEAQDRAIAPSLAGERKIVLTTSIAETSLTVEGVRVVIDCGLMRVPRFSPRTGMTRLETVTVSKVSADQRRGRAGRLGPGVCFRLWTEQDDHMLPLKGIPEILEADLAPLALELAAWGVSSPQELQWLDSPPKAAFQQATLLLQQLGALSEEGRITSHGRKLVEIGLHPRLAHMIVRAGELEFGGLACELAALLNERDIIQKDFDSNNVDLRLRVEIIRRYAREGKSLETAYGYNLNQNLCRQVLIEIQHWKAAFGYHLNSNSEDDLEACGILLAFAYPDRIAVRKAAGRYLLRNGRGAYLTEIQQLSHADYLIAAELDDKGIESRIFLAAALPYADLEEYFKDQIEIETSITWEHEALSVKARKITRLGAIVFRDDPLHKPPTETMTSALIYGIVEEGLEILPWTRAARQLQQRMECISQSDQGWPDVSDHALLTTLKEWLAPHLHGKKNRDDLQRLHLFEILQNMLSWEQRRELDAFAPTHLVVPSGSHIPINYSDPTAPFVAVRLQEMFGQTETPRIARGRVALTLHLLSPAQRPVQVTRDLASFWRNAYFEVKKDLKGRYPKHYWPDDPLHALPTNRARPKS